MRRLRGFTLIEIAVVLFIGALILGGVLQYLAIQVAAAKITATKTKQEAIKAALVNYISRNNQLPCPADPTIADGGAQNGIAAATCAAAAGGITVFPAGTPVVATGSVPWVSLGLSSEASIDGYSNRFTYQVVIAATTLNAQSVAGMKGAITVHSDAPPIVPPAIGANQTNICTPGTATYNPCAAVVVIVSHGLNGAGAYTDAGVRIPLPTGARELANANNDSAFVVRTFTDAAGNTYDDMVMALTAGELLAPLTSGGGVQDYRATLSANFNVVKNALISAASGAVTVLTGCDTQPTPMCLYAPATACVAGTCPVNQYQYGLPAADTLPTANTIPASANLPAVATSDPWGNPIKYAVTTATITPTTAANLVAFTLTSYGPDGAAGTSDDIAMIVYVSEFQALASKFR
jgi:prepilin-type N-terminal cleavage/methylation domain-containing protein